MKIASRIAILFSVGTLLTGAMLPLTAIAKERPKLTAQQKQEHKAKKAARRAQKKAMKAEMKAYRVSMASSKMTETDRRKALKGKRAELRAKFSGKPATATK